MRCKQEIQRITESALLIGIEVILEVGLILRSDRDIFIDWIDSTGADLKIHILDAPRDVRRACVVRHNTERGATFSMEVPSNVFELASVLWQPLNEEELVNRDFALIATSAVE